MLNKKLLDILKNIKLKVTDDEQYGICMLVINQIPCHLEDDIKSLLNNLFISWPKYSGNIEFPIPSVIPDKTPEECFWYNDNNRTKWVGEYGGLRKELLDFMIIKLEQDLLNG